MKAHAHPSALIVLAFVLALIAPPRAAAYWGHPGYSSASTYSTPADSPLDQGNIERLVRRWSVGLGTEDPHEMFGNRAFGTVVVGDGRAFYVVEKNDGTSELVAVDAGSGARLWSAPGISSIPVVVSGRRVWVAQGDRLLTFPTRCADPCSPQVFATQAGMAAPIVAGGAVVAVTRAGGRQHLLAYDVSCTANCRPRWHYDTSARLSAPSVAAGVAWVGTSGGQLVGFALDCGEGGSVCGPGRRAGLVGTDLSVHPPAIVGQRAYITAGGTLHAFPTDCVRLCGPVWRSAGATYGGALAVARGRVWVLDRGAVGRDPHLDAYSTRCTPREGRCSPRVALSPWDDGAVIPAFTTPTVADEMVFVNVDFNGAFPGVDVFPADCPAFHDCPRLARLGSGEGQGAVSVSDGLVYRISTAPQLGPLDVGPWNTSVTALGLPD